MHIDVEKQNVRKRSKKKQGQISEWFLLVAKTPMENAFTVKRKVLQFQYLQEGIKNKHLQWENSKNVRNRIFYCINDIFHQPIKGT